MCSPTSGPKPPISTASPPHSKRAGIPTTVRYSRGVEIAAACGQLRAKFQ